MPTEHQPAFSQPAFSQPNQSFFSQPAVHLTQPSQTNPNNVQSQQFQQLFSAREHPRCWEKMRKGNTNCSCHPVSLDEHVAVQRENKVRTLLLQALPEDHMPDFHHYDDARGYLMAFKKARIVGMKNQRR
ncbi:hypothetical protein Tco_1091804 [Tanacetum coccineum]|uniref:Uncharacterized protein n=1 Tax=Tanacetum coccineum TaxID=301880 RepID=A0ABQ5I7Z8_9ASTR